MTLYLVRHLPPEIAPGCCYGRLDVPAKNDPAVLARLATALPRGAPLLTSPLQRCRQLAAQLHPRPVVDDRLQEMDFGAWEGRPWHEIGATALDAWAANVVDFAPPGGESARQVLARALDCLATLEAPTVILVTHAGVIRVLQAWHEQRPLAECLDIRPAYGSVTLLQFSDLTRASLPR
jgi:alpha-ribazole phosphatase